MEEQKTVTRELSRRLTLPVITRMLSVIGQICRFFSYSDHIVMYLGEHGPELKFNDEDNAADEGFHLNGNASVIGEIPLCVIEAGCMIGCGCKCIRDLGYINTDLKIDRQFATCLGTHGRVRTVSCDAPPVYTLKKLRRMANDILDVYVQSVVSVC